MIVKTAFYFKSIVFNAIDCGIIWLSMGSSVMYTQYLEGYLDWKENLCNWFYIPFNIKSVDFRTYLSVTLRSGCIFELRQTSTYPSIPPIWVRIWSVEMIFAKISSLKVAYNRLSKTKFDFRWPLILIL